MVICIKLVRFDLAETYDEYLPMFQSVRWSKFLQGYNEGVVQAFASTFDGKKAIVRDLKIPVDVDFIA